MASMSPFGEHLRREREMRGVSLEELSSATRISTKFLTAIESGHWEQLPGGAFNRGFIRSASRYLGLDEDGMVAEYSLETKGNGTGHKEAWPARAERDWKRVASAAGLLILLVAGLWFAGSKIIARLRGHTNATVASDAHRNGVGAGLAQATAAPLQLVIRASSPAWVRVTADGEAIFEGEMEAGRKKTFAARGTFNVLTKDSSAVRLELNGQPVLLTRAPDHSGSVTLTAKDLKFPAGGVH
jgi:transcriptional regulator with XRE-family HTH domain